MAACTSLPRSTSAVTGPWCAAPNFRCCMLVQLALVLRHYCCKLQQWVSALMQALRDA